MSALREAAQQALEALIWGDLSLNHAKRQSVITTLSAALAQQAEPCPNCASLEAQNDELDRKLAELERAHGIIESEIRVDSHQTLDQGGCMTTDDIIRMAREAGFANARGGLMDNGELSDYWDCWPNQLERFAALVAAAEREACAKVCEAIDEGIRDHEDVAACAAAIKARGNT